MNEANHIFPKIILADDTPQKRPRKLQIKFDDPPGQSTARVVMPILLYQEQIHDEFSKGLKGKIKKFGIGGQYSAAYTDETFAILLFALGGLAGGFLGAIGQDLWNLIKNTSKKVFKTKSAKRNVLEVALQFKDLDVILHFENRSAKLLLTMLDDADVILHELHTAIQNSPPLFSEAKAVELRQIANQKEINCIFHSYRRAGMILRTLTKQPKEKKPKKDSVQKQKKNRISEPAAAQRRGKTRA